MEAWQVWLGIALLLGVVEVLTQGYFALWFALAALCTAALSTVVPSPTAQIVTWAVAASLLLATSRLWLRPVVPRRQAPAAVQKPPSARRDELVGRRGVVVEPVHGLGTVRVDGELWSARAERPLPAGTRVRVVDLDGTRLIVEEVEG